MDAKSGFQWKGYCDTTVDEVLSGSGTVQTKTMQMEDKLRELLVQPVSVEVVFHRAKELNISERTVNIAKKNIVALSVKLGNQWYWQLPESRM
ncbi:hypothetical protein [Aneurinibacillus terranovensis]|uniref:hypothetical protein n=1 Tax=Aneurinibacillus terranovensis TaxID=278991 RepID=UPI001B7FC3FE